MSKMVVIYWSGTGNTEVMANAVADGGKAAGVDVAVIPVDDASKEHVVEADFIALGCPSMGAEVLEEDSMEPFVESLSGLDWDNKKLVLFGSFDWGDGDWMRYWEERMKGYGATLVQDGLIVHLEPNDDDINSCKDLGNALVE
ncbi:flavodoxin [Vallitalea pronyensis]|uniref:Flavodoxin n=1 Tax=Vallitalea pronyensis TaxID=1348613 RepID=A0A8J8MIS5_9FIRM|nr:flavodoxin [Vallitalea pronyensis]QUI22425.1 flavodoxin [Vallitalea pronyensis]